MTDTDYVLGSDRSERERLIRQAGSYASEASLLLDQVGVRPGWRVAELGCGPLGIMNFLSERVGDTGQAVGVDNDPRMITTAREIADELGLHNVTLVAAGATDTGLERSSFNLAHARLLLVHTPQPERVVTEMSALVRPGGVVALEEVDWVSWVCQPPHPAWDRLRDAIVEFTRRRSLDMYIGRRLPELLRGVGLREVSFNAACRTSFGGGGNDHHTLLTAFSRQLGAGLVADGLLTADELDELVDELENHLEKPETLTIHLLLCQAWARKPMG